MAVVDKKMQQFRWFSGVSGGLLVGLLFDLIIGGGNTLLYAGIGAILGSGWAVGVNSKEDLSEIDEPDFEVEFDEMIEENGEIITTTHNRISDS